jgi:hypothetical protein
MLRGLSKITDAQPPSVFEIALDLSQSMLLVEFAKVIEYLDELSCRLPSRFDQSHLHDYLDSLACLRIFDEIDADISTRICLFAFACCSIIENPAINHRDKTKLTRIFVDL